MFSSIYSTGELYIERGWRMCRASAADLKVTGYVLLIVINENQKLAFYTYEQLYFTASDNSEKH